MEKHTSVSRFVRRVVPVALMLSAAFGANALAADKILRVGATQMPVDTLLSNWAHMVMTALAWTLKAWFALRLPETGRWAARYAAEKAAVLRMEFKAFLHAFMLMPVQVVRTSRRIVFRLLAWNPWQAVFLRGFDHLRAPMRS